MRDEILHIPTGIVLDLASPDLGHPEGHAILQAHYRDCHKDRPAFACLTHIGGTNPGMYLRKTTRGEWLAVHFEVGPCPSRRSPAPMSDEHKRQAEYWARAAQDAGWPAETERNLRSGTRPDVLIHGPVVTGIEVQRSAMTRAGAVERTSRAAHAGVCDVWFTDRNPFPRWAFRVPTVGQEPTGWQWLPPRQAVLATGLRSLRSVKCAIGNSITCPDSRNWCGRYHPKAEPRVVAVDEIAGRFPAGEIVALRVRAMSGMSGGVYLFPAESATLYQELTGHSAGLVFDPRVEDRRRGEPSGRAECRNVQLTALASSPALCAVCGQGFPDGRDFERHQVPGWDGRLICPDSPARHRLAHASSGIRTPNLAP
jgi:hypothetical protein